jgi:hypothetical protein
MKWWSALLDRDVSKKVTEVSGATSGVSSVQGKSITSSQTQSKTASRRGSDGKISEKMEEFAHVKQNDASKIMNADNTNFEDAAGKIY